MTLASIEPLLLHLGNGIARECLRTLPRLALAELGIAERRVATGIGGTAEADLVPRPGMRVERLADVAHDGRERSRDIEARPHAAGELRLRKTVAHRVAMVLTELVEGLEAERTRLVVQSPRDAPPRLLIRRHVEELVAVAAVLVELLVDEREHRGAGVGVLGKERVAERLQRPALALAGEAGRGDVVHTSEHDASRHGVPVIRLLEDVVVGIAAVQLRRHALPLPRQLRIRIGEAAAR